MCWAEKCCFCIKLHHGCLLIGSGSLIISLVMTITSIYILTEDGTSGYFQNHRLTHQLLDLAHLEVKHSTKELVFAIVLCVAILWLVASAGLIFGVKTKRSGFVLVYFGFGIFLTFLAMLSALLLLLQSGWGFAFLVAGASMVYIHFLVAVHTFYELQVRGKILESNDINDELLLDITTV